MPLLVLFLMNLLWFDSPPMVWIYGLAGLAGLALFIVGVVKARTHPPAYVYCRNCGLKLLKLFRFWYHAKMFGPVECSHPEPEPQRRP